MHLLYIGPDIFLSFGISLAPIHAARIYTLYTYFADGVATNDEELTGLSDAFIDADDHKAAVNDVARCLKIVADRIVEEKRRTG